ncbi:Gcd10p family-domain-containing protein [Crepidotus variabilis]|uniref:tRNA (adenine(58)-N(1))-methyltransferase non-catalytic subunit TRM6 n=1 Tax=Crepidotus variabilis TaxID=179855 RepID=A0A9P6EMV6_9AGAR|nr:Gcd10p family-domain-containing protein [Crepidotus variabilis]
MSTLKLSKTAEKSKDPGVQIGDLIMLKLPSGEIKGIKLENTIINIGKVGSFHANELIGHPYGLSYEIKEKKLFILPTRSVEEVEDTDATNELINDGEFVQPLTADEILALRKTGAHASEIIKKQIEQHANYSLKTEYSKDKYRKRKEAKYAKFFTTIEPTLFNVCEYWFLKDQSRIRDLRMDSLSQVLNLGNIRPGGRYLAVDEVSGLLVAGILERLGGEGKLITICNSDSPPAYPILDYMNFESAISSSLTSLNWATAEEDYLPVLPPSQLPDDELKSERQKSRLNKRKAISDILNDTREELFAGEFDSLIVCSEYDPYSIIDRLSPYLAGSASVVVHSPYSQILVELQAKLRNLPEYLSPSITETWLRRYQVLPGRTHPMMAMSGSGGFVLHAIKMRVDFMTYAVNLAQVLQI